MEAGHRALIYDHYRGIRDKVVGEGTHFLVPLLQVRDRILENLTATYALLASP